MFLPNMKNNLGDFFDHTPKGSRKASLLFITIRTGVLLLSVGQAPNGTVYVPLYPKRSQVLAVLLSCALRAVSPTHRVSCYAFIASRSTTTPTGLGVRSPRSSTKPSRSALRRRGSNSKLKKKNRKFLALGQRRSEVVPNPLSKKVRGRQGGSGVVPYPELQPPEGEKKWKPKNPKKERVVMRSSLRDRLYVHLCV